MVDPVPVDELKVVISNVMSGSWLVDDGSGVNGCRIAESVIDTKDDSVVDDDKATVVCSDMSGV